MSTLRRPLDQPLIKARVIRHQESRRRVEAIDQQPAVVIHRGIGGAAEPGHATLGEPISHGIQQRVGDLRIVNRFEESKETAFFLVLPIVLAVDDRGHAPAQLAVAVGQKGLYFSRLVKGMMRISGQLAFNHAQAGNPIRIVLVKDPGHIQKMSPVIPGLHRLHDNCRHSAFLGSR